MARVFQITVAQSGAAFSCREDQFILNAMISARCGPVSHGCCGGGCGVCKMRLVSGELNYAKRMSRAHISESEQALGYVLLCCVKPRSDVVIAAV